MSKLDPRIDDNAQKIKELELEIYNLKKWKKEHVKECDYPNCDGQDENCKLKDCPWDESEFRG